MKEKGSFVAFTRALAIGFGVMVLTAVILMLVLSAVALNSDDADALVVPFALTSLVVSLLVGGFVLGRLGESSGFAHYVTSGAGGVLQIVVMMLLSLFFDGDAIALGTPVRLLLYVLAVAVCVLGGAIGKPRSKKVRHGYKKRVKRR